MDSLTILSATLVTVVVVGAILSYIKLLKRRLKRYVIRYHKIRHYFEEDRK